MVLGCFYLSTTHPLVIFNLDSPILYILSCLVCTLCSKVQKKHQPVSQSQSSLNSLIIFHSMNIFCQTKVWNKTEICWPIWKRKFPSLHAVIELNGKKQQRQSLLRMSWTLQILCTLYRIIPIPMCTACGSNNHLTFEFESSRRKMSSCKLRRSVLHLSDTYISD